MAAYQRFGPTTEYAQNAAVIETILDQKVALLSTILRDKVCDAANSLLLAIVFYSHTSWMQASLAATNSLWRAQEGHGSQNADTGGRRSRRAAAPMPLIKVAELEWEQQEKMMKKQREKEAKQVLARPCKICPNALTRIGPQREKEQAAEIVAFDRMYRTQDELRGVQEMWEVS